MVYCLIAAPATAQNYLLRPKENVKEQLLRYGKKENLRSFVYGTDSSLRLSVQDSLFRKLDIICVFDKNGICKKEIWISDCEECFNKNLSLYLNDTFFKWAKVNSLLYLSAPFFKRSIVLQTNGNYSFSVIQGYLPKKKHKELYTAKR